MAEFRLTNETKGKRKGKGKGKKTEPKKKLFLKKGTNLAKGEYIYPEPTQTGTGNCAAYAGASCLWAMGLDHCPKLIPTATGCTPEAKFQYQMARLVERLTYLIYRTPNNPPCALRSYIKEQGCADKLEVSEFIIYEDKKKLFEEAIRELKKCQDVILSIVWTPKPRKDTAEDKGKGYKKGDDKARHAITLVGIDCEKKQIIAANPWGDPYDSPHVSPKKAGKRFEGNLPGGYNRYGYKTKNKEVIITFHTNEARLVRFYTVCPKGNTARAESTGGKSRTPTPKTGATGGPYKPITPGFGTDSYFSPETGGVGPNIWVDFGAASAVAPPLRYDYAVRNLGLPQVNGFAVGLDGLQPGDISRISSPPGWTSQFWFEGQETGFAVPAPDMPIDPTLPARFLGILWRTESKALKPGTGKLAFSFEVRQPRFMNAALYQELVDMASTLGVSQRRLFENLIKTLARAESWRDRDGNGIILNETLDGTYALYVDVLVPRPFNDLATLIGRLLGKA
jgi:hypothetical protein